MGWFFVHFLRIDFEKIAEPVRLKNEQKNRAWTPKHQWDDFLWNFSRIDFEPFAWRMRLKCKKKTAPGPQTTTVGWFLCFFAWINFEQVTQRMRLKNKQKSRARTPNHHSEMIFCAFFYELILSKSPKVWGLKISKKTRVDPKTPVGRFLVKFFANWLWENHPTYAA